MDKRHGITRTQWLELGFTVGKGGTLYGVPAVEEIPVSDECACCGGGGGQPCLCNHGAECQSCPDSECPCCAAKSEA